MGDTSPAFPQPNMSGTLGSPKCSIPLAGNSSQKHLPVHTARSQPTWPSSSTRLHCLAGKGKLSQLFHHCFSPAGEEPAGTSSESSFLPMDVQAQCCASSHAPKLHSGPTHPINPVPPSLQGRQTMAPPTAIPAEAFASITETAEAMCWCCRSDHYQQTDRKAAPLTAHKQLELLQRRTRQWGVEA